MTSNKREIHFQIIEFKLNHPKTSLRKIGEVFGISGERVRQICSVYQIETRRVIESHPCKGCGKLIVGQTTKKFCSEECWFHHLYTALICNTCSQIFYRRRTVVLKREDDPRYKGRNYCSRVCSAKGISQPISEISKHREL